MFYFAKPYDKNLLIMVAYMFGLITVVSRPRRGLAARHDLFVSDMASQVLLLQNMTRVAVIIAHKAPSSAKLLPFLLLDLTTLYQVHGSGVAN